MEYEIGVVTAHPVIFAWKQVKTIFRTWIYCRKNGYSCDKWYGVYPQGEEIILAQTGCLPEARDRAALLVQALNDKEA